MWHAYPNVDTSRLTLRIAKRSGRRQRDTSRDAHTDDDDDDDEKTTKINSPFRPHRHPRRRQSTNR